MKMKMQSRYWSMGNLKNTSLSESNQLYIYKTTVRRWSCTYTRPLSDRLLNLRSPCSTPSWQDKCRTTWRKFREGSFRRSLSMNNLMAKYWRKKASNNLAPEEKIFMKKNAEKAYNSERYSNQWFPLRRGCNFNMRRLEKFHNSKSQTNWICAFGCLFFILGIRFILQKLWTTIFLRKMLQIYNQILSNFNEIFDNSALHKPKKTCKTIWGTCFWHSL